MLTPNPRHSGSRWEPLPPAENVAPPQQPTLCVVTVNRVITPVSFVSC